MDTHGGDDDDGRRDDDLTENVGAGERGGDGRGRCDRRVPTLSELLGGPTAPDEAAVREALRSDPGAAARTARAPYGRARDAGGGFRWCALPLHVAVAGGAPEDVISALYDSYPTAAIEVDERWGGTPLHHALRNFGGRGRGRNYDERPSLVRMLVDRCPEALSVRDRGGMTPLHLACMCGASPDAVRALAERQRAMAEGGKALAVRGETPLHVACRGGGRGGRDGRVADIKLVRVVTGLLPKALAGKNANGQTPLHCACLSYGGGSNCLAVVRHLVQCHPPALEARDNFHETPIDDARSRKKEELVQFLRTMHAMYIGNVSDDEALDLLRGGGNGAAAGPRSSLSEPDSDVPEGAEGAGVLPEGASAGGTAAPGEGYAGGAAAPAGGAPEEGAVDPAEGAPPAPGGGSESSYGEVERERRRSRTFTAAAAVLDARPHLLVRTGLPRELIPHALRFVGRHCSLGSVAVMLGCMPELLRPFRETEKRRGRGPGPARAATEGHGRA